MFTPSHADIARVVVWHCHVLVVGCRDVEEELLVFYAEVGLKICGSAKIRNVAQAPPRAARISLAPSARERQHMAPRRPYESFESDAQWHEKGRSSGFPWTHTLSGSPSNGVRSNTVRRSGQEDAHSGPSHGSGTAKLEYQYIVRTVHSQGPCFLFGVPCGRMFLGCRPFSHEPTGMIGGQPRVVGLLHAACSSCLRLSGSSPVVS